MNWNKFCSYCLHNTGNHSRCDKCHKETSSKSALPKYHSNNTFFDGTQTDDFLHGRLRSPYYPEVLANEHLQNDAINETCYMDIVKLNPKFPSFRDC